MGILMADFNSKFQFYRAEICPGREMVLQQVVDPATHYTIQFGLLFFAFCLRRAVRRVATLSLRLLHFYYELVRCRLCQVTTPMSLLSTVA